MVRGKRYEEETSALSFWRFLLPRIRVEKRVICSNERHKNILCNAWTKKREVDVMGNRIWSRRPLFYVLSAYLSLFIMNIYKAFAIIFIIVSSLQLLKSGQCIKNYVYILFLGWTFNWTMFGKLYLHYV